MKFGPVPPSRLPDQDPTKVLMLAERWQRAAFAHERWATPAKEAVDFFEGRQWTEAQLAEMRRQKRPAMKFNVIAPIVRLVLGYQRANKTDITFQPGQDTLSSEDVAEAFSKLEKSINEACLLEFVDADVFLEGLIAARGYYDTRLDWERNDLGEVKTGTLDPFTVYPDPDADTYDLNESAGYMQVAKMVSIDEIESGLGAKVADLVRPFTKGQTPLAPISSMIVRDEITPVRGFGQREDTALDWWDTFYSLMGDFVDPHRKTIRAIETQYKVREPRNVMIDLETGDKRVLPVEWGRDKIEKALWHCESIGNPCIVQNRLVQRIHWTTMVGDIIIHDAPSFYEGYTMTGYFPYFRRGMTRGMVEDLVDPQKEKNKRRSARIEIDSKTANGGWISHQDALTPVQKANLKRFGSSPGVHLEWKGEHKPEQIAPAQPPVGARILEADADEDIRRISGINEAALGDVDNRATSGRAIEARQRQATVSVQLYFDNFKRSKLLLGERHRDIIQNYYTEPRIYRIKGEDGKYEQTIINQILMDPMSTGKRIINDVTVGKYIVSIDEVPLSATFLAAQFEEAMTLLEKMGPALGGFLPLFGDLIIGMSSMPRKQEWIERFNQIVGQQAAAAAQPAPGGAAGGKKPAPGQGQALLAGPQPGGNQPGGNVSPMQA